jgi:hypothetical protein
VQKPSFLNFKHPTFLFLMGCLFWCLPTVAQEAVPPDAPRNNQIQHRMDRFMAGLEQTHPAWLNHPELMALQWVGLPAPAHRQITTRFTPLENPQFCEVTVIQSGLLDDAISGSKTVFRFAALAGGWNLTEVHEFWKCRRFPVPAAQVNDANADLYQLSPCP